MKITGAKQGNQVVTTSEEKCPLKLCALGAQVPIHIWQKVFCTTPCPQEKFWGPAPTAKLSPPQGDIW